MLCMHNHSVPLLPKPPQPKQLGYFASGQCDLGSQHKRWCTCSGQSDLVCVCVCVLRRYKSCMLESISSSFTGHHWLAFAETKIFWLGGSQQIWIPSTSSISQSNAIVKISFSGEPTGRNIGQLWFLRSSGTICSGGGWVLMNKDLQCQDFKVYASIIINSFFWFSFKPPLFKL